MGIETLMWLFPLTFMVHEFEEMIYLNNWLNKNIEKIILKVPMFMQKQIKKSAKGSAAKFSFVVFEEFMILAALTFFCLMFEWYSFFIAITIGYLLHVVIHIVSSLYIKMYIPAVGSGILTGLYNVYCIIYFHSKGIIHWNAALLLLPFVCIFIAANLKFAFYCADKFVVEKNI